MNNDNDRVYRFRLFINYVRPSYCNCLKEGHVLMPFQTKHEVQDNKIISFFFFLGTKLKVRSKLIKRSPECSLTLPLHDIKGTKGNS